MFKKQNPLFYGSFSILVTLLLQGCGSRTQIAYDDLYRDQCLMANSGRVGDSACCLPDPPSGISCESIDGQDDFLSSAEKNKDYADLMERNEEGSEDLRESLDTTLGGGASPTESALTAENGSNNAVSGAPAGVGFLSFGSDGIGDGITSNGIQSDKAAAFALPTRHISEVPETTIGNELSQNGASSKSGRAGAGAGASGSSGGGVGSSRTAPSNPSEFSATLGASSGSSSPAGYQPSGGGGRSTASTSQGFSFGGSGGHSPGSASSSRVQYGARVIAGGQEIYGANDPGILREASEDIFLIVHRKYQEKDKAWTLKKANSLLK